MIHTKPPTRTAGMLVRALALVLLSAIIAAAGVALAVAVTLTGAMLAGVGIAAGTFAVFYFVQGGAMSRLCAWEHARDRARNRAPAPDTIDQAQHLAATHYGRHASDSPTRTFPRITPAGGELR